MSLIRTAFWLGVAIMVLPSDEKRQTELYGKAASAVHWTATFCERNDALCAQGTELWRAFRQKAEFAARMTGDLVEKAAARRLEPVAAPAADAAPADSPALEQPKGRRALAAR